MTTQTNRGCLITFLEVSNGRAHHRLPITPIVLKRILGVSQQTQMKLQELSPPLSAAVLAQSVERVDCRAGGRGFDSWGRTNTQGLKITEK